MPGIGKAIGGVIRQIIETGTFAGLESALQTLSPELVKLATRPRLDPKTAQRVYKKLSISSLNELRSSLENGEIERALGARVAYQVRTGLDDRPRILLWKAEAIAEPIAELLESLPTVSQVSSAGSLRRKKDTVGDVGFLVAGKGAGPVVERFTRFGGVQSVDRRAKDSWAFQLASGLSISLTWSKISEWGLSLVRATGSKRIWRISSHTRRHGRRACRRKRSRPEGPTSRTKNRSTPHSG